MRRYTALLQMLLLKIRHSMIKIFQIRQASEFTDSKTRDCILASSPTASVRLHEIYVDIGKGLIHGLKPCSGRPFH